MTTLEKLLQLLKVAMDNGWEYDNKFYDVNLDENNALLWGINSYHNPFNKSLNDIVTNHTNDEVSFTAALCKAMFKYYDNDIYDEDYTHWKESLRVSNHYITDSIRFRWCIEKTPNRVNFLLHTFNTLLSSFLLSYKEAEIAVSKGKTVKSEYGIVMTMVNNNLFIVDKSGANIELSIEAINGKWKILN